MKTDDPNLKPQYRMPRVFGALPGPRNVPKDKQELPNRQRNIVVSVSMRADEAALAELLPPNCTLHGEPIMTVTIMYFYNIGWLAGRGYNMISVGLPIAHQSASRGLLNGNFTAVVWENMADPIITGREELGFAKLYAEIPDPVMLGNACTGHAGWMGFPFLRLELSDLVETSHDLPPMQGQFHYKYIPRTGRLGEPDVEYLEYAAPDGPATGYGGLKVQRRLKGAGDVRFHHARWEDAPFQYPILNALADIRLAECVAATVTYLAAEGPIGDVAAGALMSVEPQ